MRGKTLANVEIESKRKSEEIRITEMKNTLLGLDWMRELEQQVALGTGGTVP